MLDSIDYKEPRCLTCEGKDFYYPSEEEPIERIPVKRIIDKLDRFLNKNDMESAGNLLEYWEKEAVALKDKMGELTICSELLGFYRKVGDSIKGLACVEETLLLLESLNSNDNVSFATIYLNLATTLKSFGKAKKAIPYYDIAENVYNKHLKKDDELFAGLYNNKALAYVDLKDYIKAEEYYKKAIDILSTKEKGMLDEAITYVNLACMYHENEEEKKVAPSLYKAFNLLYDEKIEQNGYYAYVLSKCYPAFYSFGYDKIANEMKELSEKIYERN